MGQANAVGPTSIEGSFSSYTVTFRLRVCVCTPWLTELKIHVSPDTKELLDTFNTFQLELRGPVEMKVTYVNKFYQLLQMDRATLYVR